MATGLPLNVAKYTLDEAPSPMGTLLGMVNSERGMTIDARGTIGDEEEVGRLKDVVRAERFTSMFVLH